MEERRKTERLQEENTALIAATQKLSPVNVRSSTESISSPTDTPPKSKEAKKGRRRRSTLFDSTKSPKMASFRDNDDDVEIVAEDD